MKTNRDSNMELLRFLAMVAIVGFHIFMHTILVQLKGDANTLFTEPILYKKLALFQLLCPGAKIANAIYLLISGYYMVEKGTKINISKITQKLLFQQGFAALLILFASTISYIAVNNHMIQTEDIGFFNYMCWFVGYYFAVMLSAYLFLNRVLEKTDRNGYLSILLILFAFSQFYWTGSTIDNLSNGLRIYVTGLFLYAMGGYIRKYNPFERFRFYVPLLVLAGVVGIVFLGNYNTVLMDIREYSGEGKFLQSFIMGDDYIFIYLIGGIALFEVFRRIHIPNSEIINYLGGTTFMIYLLHDNDLMYCFWDMEDWVSLLYYRPAMFLVKYVIFILATMLVGIIGSQLFVSLQKNMNRFKSIVVNAEAK